MKTRAYAVRLNDKVKLLACASGGMASCLAEEFVFRGNPVLCSIYRYGANRMEFSLIRNEEDISGVRGSVYVQSDMANTLSECAQEMHNNDKELLFIGMGCQAAGFLSFINSQHLGDRAFTVDIICHGPLSPQLWTEYIKLKSRGAIEAISGVRFKDKRNGWLHPYAYINIREEEIPIQDFVRIFGSRLALRPSCYKCPYTTTERYTDITIGDFWGIDKTYPEFYSEDGNSLVLVHTSKGQELFESVKNRIEWMEVEVENTLQSHLVRPSGLPAERSLFWKEYDENGIEYIIKKYGGTSMESRIKEKMIEFMRCVCVGGGG